MKGRFRAEEIVMVIYQRYYKGKRKPEHQEPNFMNWINRVFICLAASAIWYCLKAWRIREFIEDQDLKYDTAWGRLNNQIYLAAQLTKPDAYERLYKTGNAWPTSDVTDLLLKNIKTNLARWIVIEVNMEHEASTKVPELEDASKYLKELRRELEHSYDWLNIPERKRRLDMRRLSDSSVELGMLLSLQVKYHKVADEENGIDMSKDQSQIGDEEDGDELWCGMSDVWYALIGFVFWL